jgi:hypothetical protein
MSNTAHLLDRYGKHPEVVRLSQYLNTPQVARAQLAGLTGAQEAFVLAATAPDRLHLYVANTKEEAAYRLNDLAGMVGDAAVLFFPDSFKRPAYFDDLNSSHILQRSELVNKVSQGNNVLRFVVTYPEALFEKVVRPEVLAQNRIDISKGNKLDLDFIIEVLVEYGADLLFAIHHFDDAHLEFQGVALEERGYVDAPFGEFLAVEVNGLHTAAGGPYAEMASAAGVVEFHQHGFADFFQAALRGVLVYPEVFHQHARIGGDAHHAFGFHEQGHGVGDAVEEVAGFVLRGR